MNKSEKFAALDKLGLSVSEIEEYVKYLQNRKVETNLPIVYLKSNGKPEIQPYIDTSRKDEVWGILFGGHLWKKTCECDGPISWYQAKEVLNKIWDGNISCVPDVSYYQYVYDHCDAFNQTVALMKSCGIFADEICVDWYWCFKKSASSVCLFHMGNGEEFSSLKCLEYIGQLRIIFPE